MGKGRADDHAEHEHGRVAIALTGEKELPARTAAGQGKRFMGLVHHTDAKREWAYDRQSQVGRLDKALDEARRQQWTIVDMAADWARVFPFEPASTPQSQ